MHGNEFRFPSLFDFASLAGSIGKFVDYVGKDCSGGGKIFASLKERTGFGSIATNTYATAARTPDGSLAIAYHPEQAQMYRR